MVGVARTLILVNERARFGVTKMKKPLPAILLLSLARVQRAVDVARDASATSARTGGQVRVTRAEFADGSLWRAEEKR